MNENKNVAKGDYGKRFESFVIEKMNLEPGESHTSKWDAYTKCEMKIPVSIKLVGINNDIVFSDIFRQYSNKENFILILGVWDEDRNIAKAVYKIYMNAKVWHMQFATTLGMRYLHRMKNDFNGKIDDFSKELWDDNRKIAYKIFERETPGIISPRARFSAPTKKAIENYMEENPGLSYDEARSKIKGYGNHRIQCGCNTKKFLKEFVSKINRKYVTIYKNIKFGG